MLPRLCIPDSVKLLCLLQQEVLRAASVEVDHL